MVTPGTEVEFTVDRIVAGGVGLAGLDGRKVFIPLTVPGERVRARLVLVKRDYAVARLTAVADPSPARRLPRCPLFGRCGGCQLQHLDPEEQLRAKRELVADALRRIGRLDLPVAPVLPAPDEWHYRNKTQYAVSGARHPQVGYYAAGTHRVIPADTCFLHPARFDAARRACADWLDGAAAQAYREHDHTGNLRHLTLRTDGRRTIALITSRTQRIPVELVERLAAVPGVDAIVHNVNAEPGNRILGPETRPIHGEPGLEYELAGHRLCVSPTAFFQVNTAQAGAVVSLVRARLGDRHWARIADLYCGVGAFALALSDLADRITGVEIEPAAVADARHNAELNGRANVEFIAGDAASLPVGIAPQDAVLLDPPRKGASRELIAVLTRARPTRIIYVSCDPATLARDLALLTQAGYRAHDIQPVDMFPQTAHVETVATLDRNDG